MLFAVLQTEAQGQLQAAEVRQKGLRKQLAEQRRALASKEKEAGGLAQSLQKEQQKVDECSRRHALPATPKPVPQKEHRLSWRTARCRS